jgi:cytoskeleton protein RodZ
LIVAVIALAMWHTNGGDSSAWLARLRATANQAAAGANGASGAVAQSETASSDATAEAVAPAASATDDGQAAADNAASATPMPAPLATAAVATSAAPLAAAPKAASQAATPAASKTASAPVVATAASQAEATAAGESTVAVRVKQDSWFSVRQNDGKELFSGLVKAGDSKEISGVGPFKVTVGNRAGLDSITLDGQPVDPSKYAAAKGNVARMTLP